MEYPDWVERHRGRCTSVKKIGGSYYLYRVTSERVAGKRHPVSRQTYIGKVTETGVESAGVRIVPGETEWSPLSGLVPGVGGKTGGALLVRTSGGWMFLKTSAEVREELERLGLYEHGYLAAKGDA